MHWLEKYNKPVNTGPMAKKLRAAGFNTWRNEGNELVVGHDLSRSYPAMAVVTDIGFVEWLGEDNELSMCDARTVRMLTVMHAELVRLGIEQPL